MVSRTPQRSREEARAIARALRRRYITPEVEMTAKAELRRFIDSGKKLPSLTALMETKPTPIAPPERQESLADLLRSAVQASEQTELPAPRQRPVLRAVDETIEGDTLLDAIRRREGIFMGSETRPESNERDRARQVLDNILARFGRRH